MVTGISAASTGGVRVKYENWKLGSRSMLKVEVKSCAFDCFPNFAGSTSAPQIFSQCVTSENARSPKFVSSRRMCNTC